MLDVAQQVNAVRRTVGSRVLEAGEARIVTLSQTYDADAGDVWDACTNPERLPRWFLPVSGDLTVGGRYQFEGNAGGTVQRCDPPKSFFATWEFGGEVSWVEVRVVQEADGRVTLVLEHIAHVDDERWTQFGPGAVGVGWDGAFYGLDRHLADPAHALDPKDAEAWSVSPEGVAFLTACSEAWCAASVAAGTDPATARVAADRTTAFFTTVPGE